MSKAGKRVKSGTGSGGAKWEQALLSAQFEEDKWKANISFVVGKHPEDYTWIDILGATVASGPRKLFSVISKQQLEDEVKELGNPKGKKPKDVPQHYEVCEPCKIHLDQGTEIPLALLSRLIKYKLLAIKDKDIKRREQEKKDLLIKEELYYSLDDIEEENEGSYDKGVKEQVDQAQGFVKVA
ncbi:hypothetical protein KUTeg_012607 [Tegillarca granosa]|uniref:Uncharacterized protein n=1 Tax=Tegillarca granosa TaxID=220873 RepID=A0ABQ9F3C9_TEGGR|nr:hypothetical protein KUTeg_012607 [Tegillarca granosa]